MEGHEERGQELEYELAAMEERSDSLAEDIEDAKEDWGQKKQDTAVPGAGTGEQDEGPDPEVTGGEGSPELED